MATVLLSNRIEASRSSSDKDEISLDLKDVSTGELGVPEPPRRRWWQWLTSHKNAELDGIATQPSVFDDPSTLDVYRPPTSYENAHRFDPAARWTWREEFVSNCVPIGTWIYLIIYEQRVIRKIDLRVSLWAFIMFFALDLDRGNISQANTDSFLNDLGMNTNDFNLGNTLFRVSVPRFSHREPPVRFFYSYVSSSPNYRVSW